MASQERHILQESREKFENDIDCFDGNKDKVE